MIIGTKKTTVFGGRLRKAREAKGWSRRDLERRTGIPVDTIRQYERGRSMVGVDRLMLLAQVLEADPAWLWPVEKEDGK